MLADPEEVFLEAARRLDRWDLVQKHFSMILDVFYATRGRNLPVLPAAGAIPEPASAQAPWMWIKDVEEEVIEESSVDRFLAVNIAAAAGAREIELINPSRCSNWGFDARASSTRPQALPPRPRAGVDLLRYPVQAGAGARLAGHKEEAIRGYLEFCEKCFAQTDTLRSRPSSG